MRSIATVGVRHGRASIGRAWLGKDLILIGPAVVVLVVMFIYPLVQVVLESAKVDGGVSLSQYKVAITEKPFSAALINTFTITVQVTAACVALGVPTAYWIARQRGRLGTFLLAGVVLPLWVSLLVRTFSWTLNLQPSGAVTWLFDRLGVEDVGSRLLYHRGAVLLGMTQVMLPFLILPVYSAVRGLDPAVSAAAETLGARRLQRFRFITLPLIAPAIGAGALLVFVLSLGFFLTPALLGSPKTYMVSNMIWQQANSVGNFPLASALAVILLVLTGIAVGLASRLVPITAALRTTGATSATGNASARTGGG